MKCVFVTYYLSHLLEEVIWKIGTLCVMCLCRSLDLTGPLLLGGVPDLPEDFPVRNRDYVGCIKNLTIDSKLIDMAGFIANNGTAAG